MDVTGKGLPDHAGNTDVRSRKHSNSSGGSGHGIGAGCNNKTWQSILDGLTIKARKEDFLDHYKMDQVSKPG